MGAQQKVCATCFQWKNVVDFKQVYGSGRKVYYRGSCKSCTTKHERERCKKYYDKTKRQSVARSRRWILKHKFGLTQEEHAAMFYAQNNACAICKGTESRGKGWHVDHCHSTNKVRAILCHHCNVALGHMKDDPELLRTAADYIERHRC